MADGAHRFPGTGPFYYNQYNQQNHHPRHLTRSGSPVNSGRGSYANDTPSPSRSPVSQASSHNPYAMYNQSHQQGQHVIMNGGQHQRFMQPGAGHKYQQQSYQHHHSQQTNHHPQNQNGAHGVGHQHTFSSGTLSSNTPHFTPNNLHNGSSGNSQIGGINDNFIPNQHWQRQMQLAAESRQAQSAPHHHCKKEGVISRVSKAVDQMPAEEAAEEGEEERNRANTVGEISRQDWDALDCSGQGMRAISTSIFSYKFLKKLYLDHNRLSRLDPIVGHLRNLTNLDVSNNQIMEVPEEIGMLVNLKELLLFDNNLETLPYEVGYLFKLETLGIDGNPLDEDLKDHIVRHGTKSLVTHLRENAARMCLLSYHRTAIVESGADTLAAGTPPNERPRVEIDTSPASEILSVLSYNILCDKYATKSHYGYTPSDVLSWDYRREIILNELRDHDADIVCLQEVDRESFDEYFRRELAVNDYRGMFWPKTRAKTMAEKDAKLVDGCAIFYKGSKYICLDKILVDFANTAINRPDMKGEHDTFNRVMPRDHVAVVTFLENRMTGSRMIVGNAHIFWDPAFEDVKVVQVAILLEQISKQAEKWAKYPPCTDKVAFRHPELEVQGEPDSADEPAPEPRPSVEYSSGPQIPLIICGDFNAAAGSGVYDLITRGSLPGNHPDLGNRGYGSLTREGMTHPFKLKSAYSTTAELSFTNYTPNFIGVIDYIWYSTNALQVRQLLGSVDEEYLRKVPGFPNHHFPSDHLALKAEFSVKQRRETKGTAEINGMQRQWERRH